MSGPAAADGAVGVVAGVVVGDDGVGVIIAAIEKHANQSFVVAGVKGGGFTHGSQVQGKGQRGAGQGELTGAAQERAAAVQRRVDQVHGAFLFLDQIVTGRHDQQHGSGDAVTLGVVQAGSGQGGGVQRGDDQGLVAG